MKCKTKSVSREVKKKRRKPIFLLTLPTFLDNLISLLNNRLTRFDQLLVFG